MPQVLLYLIKQETLRVGVKKLELFMLIHQTIKQGPDPPSTQPPRPEGKGWYASDEFYPALTDPHLVRIAGALFNVEFGIIWNYRCRLFDYYKTNPELVDDVMRNSIRQTEEYYAEFREIHTGARQLSTQYMKGRQMLDYWTELYNTFCYPGYTDEKKRSIDWHVIDMNVLGHVIVQVSTTTTLDDEVIHFLEERWHRFDTFLQLTKSWKSWRSFVPTWYVFLSLTNSKEDRKYVQRTQH